MRRKKKRYEPKKYLFRFTTTQFASRRVRGLCDALRELKYCQTSLDARRSEHWHFASAERRVRLAIMLLEESVSYLSLVDGTTLATPKK